MAEKAQTEKKAFRPLRTHRACLRLHLSVRVACICADRHRFQAPAAGEPDAAGSRPEAANTELQRTLDSGDEAAYMERIARDKLGYVLPGEHIYVDMSGD